MCDCMVQTGLRGITGIRESGLEIRVVREGINKKVGIGLSLKRPHRNRSRKNNLVTVWH